jgi:hypothetical protein
MDESTQWSQRLQKSLSPLFFLSQNLISRVGVFLVTTAGVSWLFLLPHLLQGSPKDPYIGLLTVFALPGIFFLGLVLIPIGMWLAKRRHAGQQTLPATYQRVSLDNPQVRYFLMFLLVATGANVIIAGQLTSRAISYMEGDQFCGQTCHVPMQPEFVAHTRTNHAAVGCTDCHVGEGARGFISSKIAGTRQLIGVMTGSYARPIPTPAGGKRLPASETCETCHSSRRLAGDKVRDEDSLRQRRTKYASDDGGSSASRWSKLERRRWHPWGTLRRLGPY